MTLAKLKGGQLRDKSMRNEHFDENHKIDEKYLNIDFSAHKETLEARKIDVWVALNDQATEADNKSIKLGDLGGVAPVGPGNPEGIVLDTPVQIKKHGTADTPIYGERGDKLVGILKYDAGEYTMLFGSLINGSVVEGTTAVTNGETIDLSYARKMNLSSVPDDVIINGGSGFVQGATDVKAYMNLLQLSMDIYGSDELNDDGLPFLPKNILQMIAEVEPSVFAKLLTSDGATKVGVKPDANYNGTTVQAVLSELAAKAAQAATSAKEEVLVASADMDEYNLVKGSAQEGTVILTVNGAVQTPGVNFQYIKEANGAITGFTFEVGDVTNGDVLFIQYKSV